PPRLRLRHGQERRRHRPPVRRWPERLVELRILGPSGLRVSRLCLGAATFGNVDWGCEDAEAGAILDRFLAAGGNFVDTANKYADGRSEEVLGRLLGGRRDSI